MFWTLLVLIAVCILLPVKSWTNLLCLEFENILSCRGTFDLTFCYLKRPLKVCSPNDMGGFQFQSDSAKPSQSSLIRCQQFVWVLGRVWDSGNPQSKFRSFYINNRKWQQDSNWQSVELLKTVGDILSVILSSNFSKNEGEQDQNSCKNQTALLTSLSWIKLWLFDTFYQQQSLYY